MAVFDGLIKLFTGKNLVNAVEGFLGGWFDDSSVIVNRYSPGTGHHPEQVIWKSATVFTMSGDTLPEVVFLRNPLWFSRISDSIAFCGSNGFRNNSLTFVSAPVNIFNFRTGSVVWTPPPQDTIEIAYPVGSDYIVYQTQTALKWVNWRDPSPVARPAPAKHAPVPGDNRVRLTGHGLTIEVTLTAAESPELFLYTLKGELVRRISLGPLPRGKNRITIPLPNLISNKNPAKVVYATVLKTGNGSVCGKFIR